jgi:hypothetical protein
MTEDLSERKQKMTKDSASALQEFLDKQELTELIAVLSSAVDRADHDRIASCYTEDSFDDHGSFKGSGPEFADLICSAASLGRVIHHLLGQSIFELHGDEAFGETFFGYHMSSEGTSQPAFGRYIDYFQRIGSNWKIAYRRVVPDHTFPGDDIAQYWRASRDRHDPSYDRLRRPPVDAGTQGRRPA